LIVTLTPGSRNFERLSLGGYTLQNPLDYSYRVVDNTFTIRKEYLSLLGIGSHTLTFNMSGGINPTLTVRVVDTGAEEHNVDNEHEIWTGNGDPVVFRIHALLEDFFRLTQRNNNAPNSFSTITNNNYTLRSGSTIITMGQGFIASLPDGDHHFRAEFVNGFADLFLTVISGTTEGTGTPAAPSEPLNLRAAAGDRQVTLTWTAPENDGGRAIIGYRVSSDDGRTWTTLGDVTTHTFTGLTNGTAYTFVVIAFNDVGDSERATVTATPRPDSAVPRTGDISDALIWWSVLAFSVLGVLTVIGWQKMRRLGWKRKANSVLISGIRDD